MLAAGAALGAFAAARADEGPHLEATDPVTGQVLMGQSGSNFEHFSLNGNGCHSGTLGAVVTKGGTNYVLSNNHVLAMTNLGYDYDWDSDDTPVDISGIGGGGGGNGNNGRGRPNTVQVPADLDVARAARDRHSDEFFGYPGVVGTGISVDDSGNAVIEVYLAEGGNFAVAGPQIPDEIEGVPVRTVVTGVFLAL